MKISRFEDLIAWQKSQDIAVKIYQLFHESKHYSLKDQILRASVSISNNIAEGYDRDTNKEFIRFLYISKASCSEVKSMLYLSVKIGVLTNEIASIIISQCEEVNRIIFGLIRKLQLIPNKTKSTDKRD